MNSKLNILQTIPPTDSGNGEKSDTPTRIEEYKGKVALVTLGCAKNQVDSEIMLGSLASAGFDCIEKVEEADIAIVNTCGFLQSAVEEGIDTILDISDLKGQRLRKLIVSGCMVDRYGEQIKESLPEVDHFLSSQDLLKVIDSASKGYDSPLVEGGRPYFLYDDSLPRYVEQGAFSAYVKISEGCNRPCSFCIIPQIRGKMRSRDPQSVIREIELLRNHGVQEVNLVAQDLTDYGSDHSPKTSFASLLQKIEEETSIPWVRLFYAYPLGISVELLKTIAGSSRIVNYLDLPFQHVSDEILKSMLRPRGKYSPRALAETIRQETPEIALRTTFIVGYPGETEEHIAELESFLREIRFESVGIFEYSPEEGTPAEKLEQQIEPEVRAQRRAHLMEVQKEIVADKLEGCVGKRDMVLIEGEHPESPHLLVARRAQQGPEVDGTVIINDCSESLLEGFQGERQENFEGQFATVEFSEVAGYDLLGKLVSLRGEGTT